MKKLKKFKKISFGSLIIAAVAMLSIGCENGVDSIEIDDPLMDVAELSSQLSSGVEMFIANANGAERSGKRSYRNSGRLLGGKSFKGGRPGINGNQGYGLGLQQYNDDPNLQVISLVERFGTRMNYGVFTALGADINNYDENGNEVELNYTGRPKGGAWKSWEGTKIAKTIIDFGDGVSLKRGNTSISFSGLIKIDRSYQDGELTEVMKFENFSVNDANVKGTNTIVRSFNKETGEALLSSEVTEGQFVFADGTTAEWISNSSRYLTIEIGDDGNKPTNAKSIAESETRVVSSEGTVIYSHETTNPVKMDMSCASKGRKPVSGTVETVYGNNDIVVDFGDGECSSTITVTINGTRLTREIIGG
ncbi:MAG: hypothetical protein ABFS32_17385 [Bacteroidota bacterium]